MKTKFASYSHKGIAEGCKYCIKGDSLVLFISGVCSRQCKYCSLSKKRKNKNITYANERPCLSPKDLILEAKASKSKALGITGGDPLLNLTKTIKYAKEIKKRLGEKFYIHIYLPTKLVDRNKLKKLSKYIDEVRFHPEFEKKNLEKIKLASEFWPKSKIGIELPMIPENKKKILSLIIKLKNTIGFLNLNELEISDTNFDYMTKKYSFNKGGYTVKRSIEAGKQIIFEIKKRKLSLNVHLCTAETKNIYQYQNRLKKHDILPYGIRTKDGTVVYFAIYAKSLKELAKIKTKGYIDKKKNRLILSASEINKLSKEYKVERVEEFPTFDAYEIERWEL